MIHRGYLLGVAGAMWVPATLLLAERWWWFAPGWALAVLLMWRQAATYLLEGEFNQGRLTLNGRSGVLSKHSRVGPGFLLLVLEGDPWPPIWLFQDAVPDEVFRRLSRLVLNGGQPAG